jgi:hypothetical protein
MDQAGSEAVTAAFLLAWAYATASEATRARYVALGFRPDVAAALLAETKANPKG